RGAFQVDAALTGARLADAGAAEIDLVAAVRVHHQFERVAVRIEAEFELAAAVRILLLRRARIRGFLAVDARLRGFPGGELGRGRRPSNVRPGLRGRELHAASGGPLLHVRTWPEIDCELFGRRMLGGRGAASGRR